MNDTAYFPAYWRVIVALAVAIGFAVGVVAATVAMERNRDLSRWDSFELAPGDTAQGVN